MTGFNPNLGVSSAYTTMGESKLYRIDFNKMGYLIPSTI